MRGFIKFIENGETVGEFENLVTDRGKQEIIRYLCGISNGHFGKSIRLGVFNTAASSTDTALAFEANSAQVTLVSPDYANQNIIFKARLGDEVAGNFYEAGLSNAFDNISNEFGSKKLFSFESNIEPWTTTQASFLSLTNRVGGESLRLSPNTSTTATSTISDIVLDLSGYSTSDQFKIAYNVGTANAVTAFIRFLTDASNYYTFNLTPGAAAAYKTESFNKSNFTATGSPNWANITQVTVSVTAPGTGASTIDFDSLRIDDKDTYTETEILVTRTVLGASVQKSAGIPMDIEYTLDFTL